MAIGARFAVGAVIFCSFAAVQCGGASAGHDNRATGSTGSGTGSTGSGNTSSTGSTGSGGGGIVVPPSSINPDCGNGKLDASEECDDANSKRMGDGCNQACRIEADCKCTTPGTDCVCSRVCGDGILSSAEACDDANTMAGDGCSADCKTVEPNFQCRVPGKHCVPICGDMVVTGSENCDDSNTIAGDGCSSTCLTEPGWDCTKLPCTKAVCGNSMKEVGESCDKGAENGLFLGDATGCSKTCTQEPNCREGGTTTACKTPCGDGNVDPGEMCDDGNGVNGDGCSSTCMAENGFMCAGEERKDTQACTTGAGQCLVLPITYRDFDSQNLGTGHPDFFFLSPTTTCVPNASGQTDPLPFNAGGACWTTDSTKLCSGLVNAALGADGKPALGAAATCACRFTDWDQSGVLDAVGTAQNCTVTGDGSSRKRIETNVQVIKSADTFKQWYHDSTVSTKVVDKLELAQLAAGNQYQFSSSMGRTVYDDIHDIFMGAGVTSLSSGFFPLEAQARPKTCNIWPYWVANPTCTAAVGNAAPMARSQWDPRGSYTARMAGTGGPVAPVAGMQRNFYFSSEIRYLFRYVGGETLAFYGDDDVWVYVNGKLVLDLGAPHERLQGSVALTAAGATWTIQAQNITTNTAVPVGTGTVAGLGLEVGKTYEIAVFHADRHPRESNYQLTLSGFSTTRSVCQPRCGDSLTTTTEECDDGPNNNDTTYGGCTSMCKFGPFCGDGMKNGPEECDAGRMNTAHYGEMGCTAGCKVPHRCGDSIIDTAFGETCDDGANNGVGACQANCTFKPL